MSKTDLLPHNVEAERAVLGSLLIDSECIYRVEPLLKPESFWHERHGVIYKAILRLFARRTSIDLLTLVDELKAGGELEEVGGEAYLVDLIRDTPTSAHAVHYARVVTQHAVRRRLVMAAGELAKLAHEGEYEHLGLRAEGLVQQALRDQPRDDLFFGPEESVQLLKEQLPALRQQSNVLRWSTRTLNKVAPKLLPGSLVVIAARTGHGKSFLMLHEALYHARQGRPVLLATAENTVSDTLIRTMSNVLGFDSSTIFAGEWDDEMDRVLEASAEEIGDWPLYLVGHAGLRRQGIVRGDHPAQVTPAEIRRMALRMEQAGVPPALIVVDYIQALAPDRPTGNVRTDVNQVVWAIKNMALEFACPVITGCQVVRAVESRGNRMPTPADMKESGVIEEVADGLLMLIDWSQYYEPGEVIQEAKDRRICRENEWMIYSVKNRWGKREYEAGWLRTQLEFARVHDLAYEYEEELERRLAGAVV
ncbi:MAG: hypothetical protein D6814_00800 [Calditrichaeota bacterium]|nr:MAG: hypothetical protein D6814_00800 [Calditrichota bacterium]